MVFTNDFDLPTEEELTVPEVQLSSHALRAGAYHFGKYCDEQSKEYMLCRNEEHDPRKCLVEGKLVTSCALEFFRMMKKNCRNQFEEYANCLDYSSNKRDLKCCRKTQAAMDLCILEKMDLPRPELGYFSRPRSHHTERPKPEPFPRRTYKPIDELPDDYPREKNPRSGARLPSVF